MQLITCFASGSSFFGDSEKKKVKNGKGKKWEFRRRRRRDIFDTFCGILILSTVLGSYWRSLNDTMWRSHVRPDIKTNNSLQTLSFPRLRLMWYGGAWLVSFWPNWMLVAFHFFLFGMRFFEITTRFACLSGVRYQCITKSINFFRQKTSRIFENTVQQFVIDGGQQGAWNKKQAEKKAYTQIYKKFHSKKML